MRGHVASLLLVFVALGCPTDTPMEPDVSADAADSIDTGGFDPTTMAPYHCDYEPSGAYTKTAADECSLIAQDCTNTTLGCFLTDQGAKCLPKGEASCGFPCTHVNDCAPGLVCVGEPLACRALCRVGDPCPGDTVCRDMSGRKDVGFCPVPCSVVNPDCPGGDACYLLFGHMECAPTAESAKLEGEPCKFGDECDEGLICQDASDLRCLAPCTTDGQYPCDSNSRACSPLEGLQPLGVCVETGAP